MAILEIENLQVHFRSPHGVLRAVDGVSFEVDAGEIVAVVGESGCGKSVTSMSILGLVEGDFRLGGAIRLDGENVLSMSEARLRSLRGGMVGMIFQDPMNALNPVLTVGEQIAEVYQLHTGAGRQEARKKAVEMLALVGIPAPEARVDEYPHRLSGGMRQRVMIAIALACNPKILIADEPTTALDVTIQAQILLLLAELQREFNMGLILITHDLGVVARIADRVAVMYAGQIVEQGTADQVFNRPTHPYTQGLLDCIPIPGKTDRGKPLGSIPGIVPSLVGPFHACHFADRCNYAFAECVKSDIEMRPGAEAGHEYRCLLDHETCRAHAQKRGVA